MNHRIVPGLVLIAALGGCADWTYKEFDYTPPDEIRPGPGLFTGETGSFEIFSKYEETTADGAHGAAPAGDGDGGGPRAIPEGLPPDKRNR